METLPATLEDTTSTDLAILTGTASTESTHLASLGINYQIRASRDPKLPATVPKYLNITSKLLQLAPK